VRGGGDDGLSLLKELHEKGFVEFPKPRLPYDVAVVGDDYLLVESGHQVRHLCGGIGKMEMEDVRVFSQLLEPKGKGDVNRGRGKSPQFRYFRNRDPLHVTSFQASPGIGYQDPHLDATLQLAIARSFYAPALDPASTEITAPRWGVQAFASLQATLGR